MTDPEHNGEHEHEHEGEVEHEGDKTPGNTTVDRYVERFETGVRVKTEIQRGTGTNDRDKVTGEIRRRSLSEAAGELDALEIILHAHLRKVRGWDGEPEPEPETDGDEGGDE